MRREETPIRFFTRLLVAIYFIEAGLLLAAAPWTRLWDRNFFAEAWPWLQPLMATGLVRAGFVAAGIVTVLAGMSELRSAVFGRFGASAGDQPPDR